MKRILWIISLLIYLFASSSLVHGAMMGILPSAQIWNTDSCHDIHSSNSDKTKTNANCCELVYSDQYSETDIKLSDSIKFFSFDSLPIPKYINTQTDITNLYKPYFALSPWWIPDIKYQKFSDLVGIMINIS